jgi:nitrate/nitrite transporter NarK
MASVFPIALTFVQRRIPVTGQVTGYFFVGAMGGSIVLPWLIGVLIEPVGINVVMIIIAGDLVVTALLFTWLLIGWREPKRMLRVSAVGRRVHNAWRIGRADAGLEPVWIGPNSAGARV